MDGSLDWEMNGDAVRSFAHDMCNLNAGKKSGIERIQSVTGTEDGAAPIGGYPEHGVDSWHELKGGNDLHGSRPHCRVTLLQAKMNGLLYKSGYEAAWDDVSNENLVPELVHAARAVEVEYFHKLGVYVKVSREHQVASGGKIIGIRCVDVTKGRPGR